MVLDRRELLKLGALGGATLVTQGCRGARAGADESGVTPSFELEECSVADLQAGMRSGRWSAASITEQYLARIEAIDRSGPHLGSILEINPDALAIAGRLDAERARGRVRGPLHGIPVVLTDNIDTADRMQTSAGSLALAGAPAPADAGLVVRLRAAGALILAKTNMSEWANFRSERSSSGWSARGGQTRNPYALDRNPCGSSSGSGVAPSANLCTLAVGTETDGSVVCPSNACGLVGIKPSIGLVSRAGIVPISHSQDTAGPMARSVEDAALLLGAMVGEDPRDPSSTAASSRGHPDYTRFLDRGALEGARIGVWRDPFESHERVDAVLEEALAAMRSGGAELVDPVSLDTIKDVREPEYEVLLYEFKHDIAAYLATRGAPTKLRTLADLIRFNDEHAAREMPYFQQEIFLKAEQKGPLTDPAYREARAACLEKTRRDGIDRVVGAHRLDAIVAPTGGPAWTTDLINGDRYLGGSSSAAAVSGYANVTVPAGSVFGLPLGVSFIGPAFSEARLIALAYAFEQATKARRAPRFLPGAVLPV